MQLSVTGRRILPKGFNSKNAGVIGISDINRIKTMVNEGPRRMTKEEDLKKLKSLSDARVKNWPNTVQALRQRKDNERYEKFKKEELERRKLEQEEAIYQANQKKILMDKAKLEMFRRHDKVKKLHSTMLLSDVLQERDLQNEIKKHQEQVHKDIEEHHHQLLMENVKRMGENEKKKAEELRVKKKQQQQVLKQQHEEFRERYLQKLRENILEGEIMKAKAKQLEEQAKREEQDRKRKIMMAQEETRKANDYLQAMKANEKTKEKEEERKMQEYAEKRRLRLEKRKEDNKRKFEEKQAIRQKLIDKTLHEMENKKNYEEILFKKQVNEAKLKEQEELRKKAEKKRRMELKIKKDREIFHRNRKNLKDRETKEDKEFQQFRKEKNKEIEETLKREKQDRRDMNKALAAFQKKQMADRQRERELRLMKEMEEADMINKCIENDEKMFRTYAERCLNEWQANGKNVNPIILELKRQRKQNLENL